VVPEFDLVVDDLLRAEAPSAEAQDPVDDGELQLLVQLTTEHCRRNLPEPSSFPMLALRAMELVQRPDVEVRQLTSLVAQDPALSACVLRLANSARFGRGTPVANLTGAIARLGLQEVATTIAGAAARALYDPTLRAEYRLFTERWNTLFHLAMTSALAAGQLASALRRGHPARAFIGGLFQDIGKSIALRSVCALVLSGRTRLHPEDRAIDRLLDRVHVEVGVELHRTWGLPEWMSDLCRLQHEESVPLEADWDDLHLVRAASGLALLRFDPLLNLQYATQVLRSLRALGLGRSDLLAFKQELEKHAARVASSFDIPDPAGPLREGGPA
jgi:HD-like signal output (HDOD) protein